MLSPSNSRRRNARARSALFVAFAAFVLTALPPARAQQRQAPAGGRPLPTIAGALAGDAEAALPYRFGQVVARAPANAFSMTVPLGMSKGGVVLVEFPADDPVYSFHEGNARLAYVNCGQQVDGTAGASGPRKCSMRPTDALVFQPGADFVAGKEGAASTTVITVQRASGMVVSFPLFLVNDAARNANNVVISYDVKTVIALRKRAGLLTHLASPEAIAQDGRVPATSPLLTPDAGAPSTAPSPAPKQGTPGASDAQQAGGEAAAELSPEEVLRDKTVAELQRVAGAAGAPAFTKPVHGLAVALLAGEPPVAATAIQVIAVRNTLSVPVRLLPDQPDIRIMQSAKKGDAILEQPVPLKYVATTLGDDNVLKPGEVYYFAVAYETPALGVRQSLCASFAHMMASDAPAVVQLTSQIASR